MASSSFALNFLHESYATLWCPSKIFLRLFGEAIITALKSEFQGYNVKMPRRLSANNGSSAPLRLLSSFKQGIHYLSYQIMALMSVKRVRTELHWTFNLDDVGALKYLAIGND